MRVERLAFRGYIRLSQDITLGISPPVMENQTEKQMENENGN